MFDLPELSLWVEEAVSFGEVLLVLDLVDVQLLLHTQREAGAVVDFVGVDRDRTKTWERNKWVG